MAFFCAKERLGVIGYIVYLIDNARFNAYYKSVYGAQISLFDNCGWSSYKRNA